MPTATIGNYQQPQQQPTTWWTQWKDLLKIYGLVLGAFIITFPVYITVAMMIVDPALGVFGLCLGLFPFIFGALILYYLLKKKVKPSPYYYMYSSYTYNPYGYSYPSYGYGGFGYPPQTGYYSYSSGYGYNYGSYPYGYPAYGGSPYAYQPQPVQQSTRDQILPTEKDEQEEKLELPAIKWLFIILIVAIGLGFIFLAFGIVPLFIPCFIIGFSFPSLVWIAYVYKKDIYEPEPGRVVLIALTWGLLSTIPSLIFEAPFIFLPAWATATIVAPFVEELFKPMIIPFLRIKIDNELDGMIYGVTAGMGFAMMENLFYEMGSFVSTDLVTAAAAWSVTTLMRGLGSTIIHAVGVGVVGYAYARYHMKKTGIWEIGAAYMFAVGLHAIWNGTLSGLELVGGDTATLGMIVFIVIWPIVEFIILKAFLDKATHLDELMFGPMGERPFGKPKPSAVGGAPGAQYPAQYPAQQQPAQAQARPVAPAVQRRPEPETYGGPPPPPSVPPTIPGQAQPSAPIQRLDNVPGARTQYSPPPPPPAPRPSPYQPHEEVIGDDDLM